MDTTKQLSILGSKVYSLGQTITILDESIYSIKSEDNPAVCGKLLQSKYEMYATIFDMIRNDLTMVSEQISDIVEELDEKAGV